MLTEKDEGHPVGGALLRWGAPLNGQPISTNSLKGIPMKNFIQTGVNITVAAPAAVASGAGVLVGKMFGFASADAASGAEVTIVRQGVFGAPKVTGQSWTVGAAVYWDSAAKKVTTTAGGNQMIGCAVVAAASDATSGTVLLDGVIRA